MKKRKIVLGLAMAALTALSLSACDDASTSTPATNVTESGNGTQTTTGGNTTSGNGTQTTTGGNTTGGEGTQTTTGGNTTGGEGTQTTTGGNTTGGEGTQTGTGGNNSQQQENLPTPVITNTTDGVQVLNCAGDQESLYAEFTPVTNADSYNVYVKGGQYNDYTKIDTQLTRLYKKNNDYYYRTDAVGLKKGLYEIKVVPVINDSEVVEKSSSVNDITVIGYDRTGFAFSSNQYNSTGDASGAYNADGTLKANARILYVTKDNAKTVSLSMTTSSKGEETKTGLQAILSAYEKGFETRPLAIRVMGKLSKEDLDSVGSSEEGLQIKGKTLGTVVNCTIEGIGNDATVYGFGLMVKNCTNLEIRNLAFMTKMDDDVSLDGGSSSTNRNIWVHDNDFFYGANGGGDHAKGDGALDIKGTQYATLSYNHFWDTGKTTLNSNGDPVDYVSYHHNWFDHSDSRHPRVRMSKAIHVYNNYFDGVSKYGIGAAEGGTSIFSENNYYRNTKNPIMSSMQGTDVYAGTSTYSKDNATFSKEDGGIIKSYGDVMTGNYTFIPYGCTTYVCKGTEIAFDLANTTSTVNFDAYVASTRDEKVPDTVVSVQGGTKYSNFDTDSSIMYSYTVQTPEDAVNTIQQYCGRVQGGDLKWTFDNATEDTNYVVIPGLRSAIDNYSSNLVSVQGANETTNPDTPTNPETPDTPTNPDTPVSQSGQVCTFPYTGSFFAVTGNTSTSKGSATYNGTTYTTVLKMESSTKVEFTTTASATLTIVFSSSDNANCKIDGTKKTADANRVITITLEAGSHTITKGDTANIAYISIQ